MILGLQQGIVNAWKGFMGWIHGLIMKIPKGIRDALGIHSPSTVMADIGGNMGKGLFDVGFIPSIRKGMDAAQALLRTRTAGLGAAASTDISAQVNARITGGTSSALGTLAQIRDHLATLVAKTPGASDIARATRIQTRMGVAT
jgi:hypothetical protein